MTVLLTGVLFATTHSYAQISKAQPTQVTSSAGLMPTLARGRAYAQYCIDLDGDWFFTDPRCSLSNLDCNDSNGEIRPHTAEVCDNGVDDNCDGELYDGCLQPPQNIDLEPKPFLSFSWGLQGISKLSEEDLSQLVQRAAVFYGFGHVVSITQNWLDLINQRTALFKAINPSVAIALYYSAITTNNPISRTEHTYPDFLFEDDGNFLCEDPSYWCHHCYAPGVDECGPLASPLIDELPATCGGASSLLGRWPFYNLKARNGVLACTTYLCRPVIDVRSSYVKGVVFNDLRTTKSEYYKEANAIALDNASLMTNTRWNNWPGKGQCCEEDGQSVCSPYYDTPPDQDFLAYLNFVRAVGRTLGSRLILNGAIDPRLAPHADFLYHEKGFARAQKPEEFRQMLNDVVAVLSNGTGQVLSYDHEGVFTQNPAELKFFLAAMMLAYNGKLTADLLMTEEDIGYFPQYHALPTWLQEPKGPYQEISPNVYLRLFENGLVILNANDTDVTVPDDLAQRYEFSLYGVDPLLTTKSANIFIPYCSLVTKNSAELISCQTHYQRGGLARGEEEGYLFRPSFAVNLVCKMPAPTAKHEKIMVARQRKNKSFRVIGTIAEASLNIEQKKRKKMRSNLSRDEIALERQRIRREKRALKRCEEKR